MSRIIAPWVLGVLAGALLAGCTSRPAAEAGAEPAAVAAAEGWLTLTDAGKYAESWQAAAAAFRTAVSEDQWQRSLEPVRRPMGKVLSRKVKKSSYHTSLPGAPDGQYVVIQFEASFEGKAEAVETVTPMLEPDGAWRVSGYFIK